jgi:hypothetical protein
MNNMLKQKKIRRLIYKHQITENTDLNSNLVIDENLYKNIRLFKMNKRIALLDSIMGDNSEIKIDEISDVKSSNPKVTIR